MLIEKNNPLTLPIVLDNLNIGDGFAYKDDYYIIINRDCKDALCINLATGNPKCFPLYIVGRKILTIKI